MFFFETEPKTWISNFRVRNIYLKGFNYIFNRNTCISDADTISTSYEDILENADIHLFRYKVNHSHSYRSLYSSLWTLFIWLLTSCLITVLRKKRKKTTPCIFLLHPYPISCLAIDYWCRVVSYFSPIPFVHGNFLLIYASTSPEVNFVAEAPNENSQS